MNAEDIRDTLALEGVPPGTRQYTIREMELKRDQCLEGNGVPTCQECNAYYFCDLLTNLQQAKSDYAYDRNTA